MFDAAAFAPAKMAPHAIGQQERVFVGLAGAANTVNGPVPMDFMVRTVGIVASVAVMGREETMPSWKVRQSLGTILMILLSLVA